VATTTLTGTTGNDILNAPGSVSTLVQGLQGNDTITLALANDEAQAGAGNDGIRIARTGVLTNTISGGDGNDTVTINSAGQFNGYIDLGAGADSIVFSGAGVVPLINGGRIFGNEGNDTIALTNQIVNAVIGAGSGNDLLSFTAGATIASTLVNGGVNKDSITFAAGVTSFTTVSGGKGNDSITFTAQVADFTTASVGGGQGADSINVNNFVFGTVAGGGLNDTIRFNGAIGSASVIFGDGAGVTTEGTGTEGAADGADLIISTQGNQAGQNVSIYGAGGNDTISFSQGFAVATANQIVDGGNGADSINWGVSSEGGSIFGGAGNDTIFYAGTNTIQGDPALFAVVTLSGGAGTDLIRLGVVNTQGLVVGQGTATGPGLTQSGYYAVLSGVSGDTVRALTGMTFTAGGSNTSVNWAGSAPSIYAASSNTFSNNAAGIGNTQDTNGGSIAVFSDGTDSVIGIMSGGGATSQWNRILVKGVDLTITTAVGGVVATATAFRFSIAANSGGGMNITFA